MATLKLNKNKPAADGGSSNTGSGRRGPLRGPGVGKPRPTLAQAQTDRAERQASYEQRRAEEGPQGRRGPPGHDDRRSGPGRDDRGPRGDARQGPREGGYGAQGPRGPGDRGGERGGDRGGDRGGYRPDRGPRAEGAGERRPFGDRPRHDSDRPAYQDRSQDRARFEGDRPRRPDDRYGSGQGGPGGFGGQDRPRFNDRPQQGGDRPRFDGDRPRRPDDRYGSGAGGGDRPRFNDRGPQGGDRPRFDSDRPRRPDDRYGSGHGGQGGQGGFGGNDRPRFNDRGPQGGDRPRFEGDRPRRPDDRYGSSAGGGDRPRRGPDDRRPAGDRPYGDRPQGDRPYADRPRGDDRYGDRPAADRGERGNWGDRGDRAQPPHFEARGDHEARTDRPPRAEAPRQPAPTRLADAGAGERLSKRMSELGLASRREADEWIQAGWVTVDGQIAELGLRVGPDVKIEVDPAARDQQAQRVTILLNKPIGYVSGQAEDGYEPASVLVKAEAHWGEDPSGVHWAPGHGRGLAPAGRLDIDSTGLLVLTQDGRIARHLIGEDSTVEKEYLVRVAVINGDPERHPMEQLDERAIRMLNHGLELDGVQLKEAKVSWANEDQLRFVLREGRKRQIRRMCELVGLNVLALKRVRIGRIPLGNLPAGQWRYLAPWERF
ncbi:pseudouridine synthase [Roseateles amylovorans]|uniref:Dual-specificity RNA pseudouridine synthase RluF n=1 Tax=Roseateles amylovorans TaxID=2978473 RepID=A0ABY6AY65_9BURK|nr:pseudouridine synthase [Roseateles amylovorans]UXH76806.1 pseudouridine synthase [Roseateles amylovorans]